VKKYLQITFLFLVATLFGTRATATHIFGGELLYTHLSANTYNLKLTLYGDCAAPGNTFNSLFTAHPGISIYRGTTLVDTLRLQPEPGTGDEVSPVCPAQLSNTTCNGGSLPGVTKFVYTTNITINIADANWRFVFDGDLLGSNAGRSSNITNIAAPSSTNLLTLEARLNNTNGDNSSPVYNTIPTPFYAINLPQEYNHGAVDPDGDSLSYSLIAAVDANGSPVNYLGTASPAAPLYTAAGQFNFDQHSGQMSFIPNLLQYSVVVNEVREYKNGILVGTSMREMTFIVLDNLGSANDIRNTNPVNISGGGLTGNNIITTCKSGLSFDIAPGDVANNSITVSYTSLPPGASLAISNNSTPSPILHFNWDASFQPSGSYIFYVIYKNNACPISTSQTIAYTIHIAEAYKFVSLMQYDDGCEPSIPLSIVFSGQAPVNLYITQQADTLRKLACLIDTISFSIPAGNYTGTFVSTDRACATPFNFTVSDSTSSPCCRFSYPGAFSPNNDGRNDRFKVISSSQPARFELHIYDRWGNKVFTSNDPQTGWDGTWKGRPCSADVYFYRMYALCQGKAITQKGDLTLVQ